ncbi:MAG: MBL fold metallo-hydrolase [Candidatus Micrarchaeales archaeon]
MKITFIGNGEAFDENVSNISFVVESNSRILFDCGYSVPQNFWKLYPDKDYLDAVFVSHFHADHVAGLPMLIMRMRQEKRSRFLKIIGPEGFRNSFKALYELLYKGFWEITGFDLIFVEMKGGDQFELGDLKFTFANASHLDGTPYFVPTLAARIDSGKSSICYSSDTIYSERIIELAKDCNLLIHDSYLPESSDYHKKMNAHCSPKNAGIVARKSNASKLLLFNINRAFNDKKSEILNEAKSEFEKEIIIPISGQSFEI